MKKVFLWMLLTAMVIAPAAAESNLSCAANRLESGDFANYPSYWYDEATGNWGIRTLKTDAMLDWFWSASNEYNNKLCVFALEAEADEQTSVRSLVLRFYFRIGKTPLNATSVSLLLKDTRYDFAASSTVIENGNAKAECITVPLTEDALSAVYAMAESNELAIRLIGDTIYTTTLNTENTGVRQQIEAASLVNLYDSLTLADAISIAEYSLWDLSAASWKDAYGFTPSFEKSQVVNSISDAEISDAFGMILPGSKGAAATAAQNLLIDAGYLAGKASTTFGNNAENAVRRAQRYFGMIENGCMDARLAEVLAGNAVASAASEAAAMQNLGSVAAISVDRYWFADAVSASAASGTVRTVSNENNTLLIADGAIASLSESELRLFMQLDAKLVYGDKGSYSATILCERDAGMDFDTAMLPLAQSRLVIYAEIPAHLALAEGDVWTLEITAGGETLKYTLQ